MRGCALVGDASDMLNGDASDMLNGDASDMLNGDAVVCISLFIFLVLRYVVAVSF